MGSNHDDYLAFDISGKKLCPPYPECIGNSDFWYQDTSLCHEIGDINLDYLINILDVILLISYILDSENLDYQELIVSDINEDNNLDILDVVNLVSLILN